MGTANCNWCWLLPRCLKLHRNGDNGKHLAGSLKIAQAAWKKAQRHHNFNTKSDDGLSDVSRPNSLQAEPLKKKACRDSNACLVDTSLAGIMRLKRRAAHF